MHIALCLDYSSFTEEVLTAMQSVVQSFKEYKVSVIHIIDEALFTVGTGFEIQLNEDLKRDSGDLKKLSIQYLGANVNYIEEYGIPRQKIDGILGALDHDMLAIGNHSKSILGTPRLGGIAEHLLLNSAKPVLVIS